MDNSEEGSENLPQQDQESLASDAPADATNNGNAASGSTSIAKPIRRRSRASKKSPNTLRLSATPDNFRSLLQKYTGSSSSRKGPITLNFADYNYNDSFSQQSSFLHQQHHHIDYGNFSTSSNNTTMEPFAAGDHIPPFPAATTSTEPVFVPTGEVEDFIPDEEFTIDEDLAIMLQELQSEPPGNYLDFPAGSNNNNNNNNDDFW